MRSISPEEFSSLLRELSTATFTAFVADLWRARGYDVRVEDAVGGTSSEIGETDANTAAHGVVVLSDAGTERRLVLHHDVGLIERLFRTTRLPSVSGVTPNRDVTPNPDVTSDRDATSAPGRSLPSGEGALTVPADIDVIVTSARNGEPRPDAPPDVRVVDADDLRRIALYAVDRTDCEALFESHFGRSPIRETTPPRGGAVAALADSNVGLLLIVAAVALGAVVGVPGMIDGGLGTPASPSTTPLSPADADGPVAAASDGANGSTGTAQLTATDYPPGLSSDGVASADRLAKVHSFVLAGHSYRWTITYRETVAGETRGYLRETVAVENATVYRSTVEENGAMRSGTLLVGDRSTYADGETRYDRIEENGTARYRSQSLDARPHDTPQFFERPYRLVEWYLSVQESQVVRTEERDGTTVFLVRGVGDTWPRTTNVTTTAVVDEYGVVRELRRTHQPPDTAAVVVVTFRLEGIDDTTVTPPPWLGEARRATADE